MNGPLPIALDESTMISSLMEKSIVMIGGKKKNFQESSDLLELSGDSIDTMEWKILKQKLQCPRPFYMSYSISNEIAATFKTKMSGFSPLFCDVLGCYLQPFKL